ncbi:MAG: 4-hydroxy-tetrahydrodipicolinate reductase [Alphaproteobacteria bacterium]|nr:4-hydroxy-tetrahydrodipicolinate reductase [Alphaproteobacteria bacterium]
MSEVSIGIVGAAGRMGQMLVKQIGDTPGARLVAAAEAPNGAAVGKDAGEVAGVGRLGVLISGSAETVFERSQVVIDFTAPRASVAHAELAATRGTAMVLGTTGLSADEGARIRAAAAKAPIVWADNMSVGVTLLAELVRQVAGTLDPAYDIEIVEMHHKHKVDAPSGTALLLGRAAAAGRKVDLAKVSQRGRDGITGARKAGDIGFASLRGGDVVGDHTVVFAGPGERIELGHRAQSRQLFAQGAVRAALWVAGRGPGLYSMKDVLGLTT